MKNVFIRFFICIVFVSFSPLISKEYAIKREGLYGSVAVGPSYGKTGYSSHNMFYPLGNKYYNGVGLNADLKGGYAVSNNVVLHVTLLYNRLYGLREDNEPDLYPHKDLIITSYMYGLGATYYTSPSNFFYSLSAGLGKVKDNKTKLDYMSDPEDWDFEPDYLNRLAFQYKMGREWRVGASAYLGVGLAASWNSYYQYNDYDVVNFGVFLNSSF